MKKALIHLGTHKTGTTSIQHYLSDVELGEIIYPKIRWPNQNILSIIYRDPCNWFPYHKHLYGSLSSDDIAALKEEVRNHFLRDISNDRDLLLSCEMFFEFDNESIIMFKNDLQQAGFQDFKIVLYARNPADLYLSLVQQRLRYNDRVERPEAFKYGFKENVLRWMRHFPDAIRVFPYERESFPHGDVVTDFVRIVNRFFHSRIPEPEERFSKNVTMSIEEMTLIQQYRQDLCVQDRMLGDPKYQFMIRTMFRLTQDGIVEVTKPRLRDDLRAYIIARHSDEITYIKGKFNIVLPGCDIVDDIPAIETFRDVDEFSALTLVAEYDVRKHIRLLNHIIDVLVADLAKAPPKPCLVRRIINRIKRSVAIFYFFNSNISSGRMYSLSSPRRFSTNRE